MLKKAAVVLLVAALALSGCAVKNPLHAWQQGQETTEISTEPPASVQTQPQTEPETEPQTEPETEPETQPHEERFLITLTGDCTLGADPSLF